MPLTHINIAIKVTKLEKIIKELHAYIKSKETSEEYKIYMFYLYFNKLTKLAPVLKYTLTMNSRDLYEIIRLHKISHSINNLVVVLS